MVVTFDTLKASRRLQEAGFDETKAEAIVSIFAADIGASLATKDDLATTRTDLTHEINTVRTDLTHEINMVRADMKEMEQRLTVRMGTMLGGGVAVLLAAMGIVTAIVLAAP